MTVGERIKEVREKTGMSQVDFADKINVSKQTLYKYENNLITNIPSDKIEAVAKVGGVSPAYLMGWTNIKASGTITLYNVHCETKSEAELILSYRKLSSSGQKRVSSYTSKLLDIEKADVELNAAHDSRGDFTTEERQEDEDMLD